MTVRLHPDGQVGGGIVTFNDSVTGNDVFWDAIGAWLENLPEFVDAGNYMLYEITNSSFTAFLTAPNASSPGLGESMQPFLSGLVSRGIPYNSNLYTSPDYLTHYASEFGPLPYGPFTASQLISNRLIPRNVVLDPKLNADLVQAMRLATKTNDFYLGCQATNARKPPATPSNAVLPAWRNTTSLCLVVGDWDWGVPRSEMVAREQALMETIMPVLMAATPNSGTYLNEGNFAQPNWQKEFYGEKYPRLQEIKEAYDPDGIFFGLTAVGSEKWALDGEGRLCSTRGTH